MGNLEIEPAQSKDVGACRCCKAATRTIWGFVYRDGTAHACYFVQWTLGHLKDRGARIDVVIGDWNPGAPDDALRAISHEARFAKGNASFELVDAKGRPAAEMGRPMSP